MLKTYRLFVTNNINGEFGFILQKPKIVSQYSLQNVCITCKIIILREIISDMSVLNNATRTCARTTSRVRFGSIFFHCFFTRL